MDNAATTSSAAETDALGNNAESVVETIAYIGSALSPFFLQDPRAGEAAASFQAMASLSAEDASTWPFVDDAEATACLSLMIDGLSPSMEGGTFAADDSLTWEYRRLFIGPQALPAPPWGSVYTDYECVMFGASTLALIEWMRAHGIARTAGSSTPEDHIGLMLELMAWIASNQPENLDEFLRDHLLTWSSHYLIELEEASSHDFYRGLARLTRLSLEGARDARGIAVNYPRYYR